MSDATNYNTRRATQADVPVILDIYAGARAFMRRTGNPTQWPDGYPGIDDVLNDIEEGKLYVCVTGEKVFAVFFLADGPDPTYAHIDGRWLNDEPYSVIHRIAARVGTGAGRYCIQRVCDSVQNLRIDTHEDNLPMRHVLRSLGFVECGTIICNDGTPRIAYQHTLAKGSAS
ncbi:MAG: N-acetyltransferase [Atopobiaceae bacterium]|nr:N-acetyltransferase [Atopobiaceae bacterium]